MVEVVFRGPKPPSGFQQALSQAGQGFGQGFGAGLLQQQQVGTRQGFLEGLVQNPFQQAADALGPGALTDPNAPSVGDVGQAAIQADPRQQVLQAIQQNPGILADENAFNQILAQLQPPQAAEEPTRIQELRAAGIDPSSPEGREALLRSRNALAEEPEQPEILRLLEAAEQQRAAGRERAAGLLEQRAEGIAGKSIDRIRAEAFAQAQGRGLAEQQFATPEPQVPEFLDSTGAVTRAATGEVRRQVAQLFGGSFNPQTGRVEGLGPKNAQTAQQIQTMAERILQTGSVSGISEAVARAMQNVTLPDEPTGFGDLGDDIIRLAEEEVPAEPGEFELSNAEARLRQQMDVADATGVGSTVVSFLNNTLGQVAPGVVDKDVVRGRQRLALLQGDFINAFNRNPRLPVWEQQRLSEIFSGPDILSSPEAVREALAEMDRGLSREIEFRRKLLSTEQVPVDAKQDALETLQNLAQFRRRVREFDVRSTEEFNRDIQQQQPQTQSQQQQQPQPQQPQQQQEGVTQTGPGDVRMTIPPAPERPEPGSVTAPTSQRGALPERVEPSMLTDIDPRQLTPAEQRGLLERMERDLDVDTMTEEQAREAIRILDIIDPR